MESEILIQVQNAVKSYGGKRLFQPASFEVKTGQRIALIGPNGGGKSTLLKMIVGELPADEGAVVKKRNLSLGYLSQAVISGKDQTLYEEVSEVFAPVERLNREIDALCLSMAQHPGDAKLQEDYARKEAELERRGGYDYAYRVRTILDAFGFPKDVWDRRIATFSGGEKSRMAFCKLLLENPELLILDEPTNHLDVMTIEWLEDYLKAYRGAVLFVSHDKAFINGIATEILELENGILTSYTGNYDRYAQEKKKRYEQSLKEYAHQREQIAKIERFIAFYMPKPRFASRAHDREKKLERIKAKAVDKPVLSKSKVHIDFRGDTREDRELARLEDLSIGYPDGPTLVEGISFTLRGRDHLVVMGENGSGKTTFVKTLMGKLPPKGGSIEFLSRLNIGYLRQDFMSVMDPRTIFDYFKDLFPTLEDQRIYDHLGKFAFSYEDDRTKAVESLSGGEQMRVILAKLCLMDYDVLILDEPTNHLDLMTKSELSDALVEYKGTLVIISHDRDFVDAIGSEILYFHGGKAYFHKGSYSEFRDGPLKGIMEAQKEEISKGGGDGKDILPREKPSREKPKRVSEFSLEHLMEKIAKKEEEIAERKRLVDDPAYYSNSTKLAELQKDLDDRQREVDALYAKLEEMTGRLSP